MGAKILVVDDSMMVRRQVGKALTDAGFEVQEAVDGKDALGKLEANPETALVVCDINMPVMNGLDFLAALKGSPMQSKAQVVMLTTEGQPELMQEAKALGAKGWIIKPFKPELLVAAATKLVKAS